MNFNRTFQQNKKRLKLELGLYFEKKDKYDDLKRKAQKKACIEIKETNAEEILDKLREIYGNTPSKHNYENNWLKEIIKEVESDKIFLRPKERENLAIIKFLLQQKGIFKNSKIKEEFFTKNKTKFELKDDFYRLTDYLKERPQVNELKIATRFFRTHYKIFAKDLELFELKNKINSATEEEFNILLAKNSDFFERKRFAFQLNKKNEVIFKNNVTLSVNEEVTKNKLLNEKQLFLLFLERNRRW